MMELFKLWDSDGNIVAKNATESWCWEYIRNYAKARNLGYYYRSNLSADGVQEIDYGSHTHFFYLKEVKWEVEQEHTCARYEVLDNEE